MRQILSARHIGTLARFARTNVLVAFDYDGTLAPIASDPARARMRATTRRLLASAARRYPCVVISGRSCQDLERRLEGIPVSHLSGNYGLEPWEAHPHYRAQVQDWVRRLDRRLAEHTGVVIEDKAYSVTIHYRHAPDKAQAVAAIRAAVGELSGARAIGAQQAISVLPAQAAGKGAALERTCRLLACETAIYVGDDETDEEAFSAIGAAKLIAVRVGGSGPSKAGYGIRNQAEIDRLLRALIRLREPASSSPRLRRIRLKARGQRDRVACA